MTVATRRRDETEATILARLLGGERGTLSPDLARHILELGFSEPDKVRMHDLAVRNQDDALTPEEKAELLAFVTAGDVLAVLKSKARRALAGRPTHPDAS
ncbi:hypothetical protein [Paludisphaera soli]|uniref:hypothetical protein n=1 Tax=Paludisphaera soli TaxID=2712865 RepID=UPI0013EB6B83|nr:hypothetical protein [Paludisphaera soli]